MATRSIQAVAQHLEALLAGAGWRVQSKEVDEQRIEDEVWCIESTWSPQGATAYLTFIIDRHPPVGRGKAGRAGIWRVRASRNHPERHRSDQGDDVNFYLEKHWIETCPEFVKNLSRYRFERPKQESNESVERMAADGAALPIRLLRVRRHRSPRRYP